MGKLRLKKAKGHRPEVEEAGLNPWPPNSKLHALHSHPLWLDSVTQGVGGDYSHRRWCTQAHARISVRVHIHDRVTSGVRGRSMSEMGNIQVFYFFSFKNNQGLKPTYNSWCVVR